MATRFSRNVLNAVITVDTFRTFLLVAMSADVRSCACSAAVTEVCLFHQRCRACAARAGSCYLVFLTLSFLALFIHTEAEMTSALPLIFLKLGGSLITEKATEARAVRTTVLQRLMTEIAEARKQRQFRLVLGHGAGSFGHVEAKRHGTRQGVSSNAQWHGFLEVQV